MFTLNQNGLNIKHETGGESDSIPIELPYDIEVDSNTKLVWSGSYEQNIADWTQILFVTAALAACVVLFADDAVGGFADDGIATTLASYVMSTLSGWMDVITSIWGTMAPALACG